MKRLFIMDMKDYDPELPHFRRPSVRAVVMKDGLAAMVYSKKYDYYKFPGGGIEKDESLMDALIREVREETGLTVIPESVTEYGSVLRIQKSQYAENTIFEQENLYFRCDVTEELSECSLDDYESDEGFCLVYISPDKAAEVNREHDHHGYDSALIKREEMVLELLQKMQNQPSD